MSLNRLNKNIQPGQKKRNINKEQYPGGKPCDSFPDLTFSNRSFPIDSCQNNPDDLILINTNQGTEMQIKSKKPKIDHIFLNNFSSLQMKKYIREEQ